MKELRDRRKLERFFYSGATIALLSIALLLLLSATWGVYQKYHESKVNREYALKERDELREHQNDLEEELAQLKTPEGIESEIREKFGFVKEGEGVIVIVDPPTSASDKMTKGHINVLGIVWSALVNIFR